MNVLLIVLLLISYSGNSHTEKLWGKNGHRVVGDIASEYLNDKARNAVDRILGPESMAIASTWMDEVRSDPQYNYTSDWHWVTIPDGKSYEETEKNPNGDIIKAIRTITSELKSGALTPKEEREHLKMLIHLVGDLHMPLHVGTGEDRGGNDIRVNWFREPTNLHSVWDSGMIDEYDLSYTELSTSINHPTEEQVIQWQSEGVLDWAKESINLRDRVYNLPDDHFISYEYMFHNFDTIERRLLQAGIRLAGVLNSIYGN